MQRVRFSSQQAPVHKLGDPQMTLSPKFRLAVVQSNLTNPSPELDHSLREEPLIPGLPDDVALNCLLRLPVQSHSSCRAVCKRWHMLLGNKERFFTHRKQLGLKDPWLFVFAYHKCTGKIQWQVLDLTHFSWHTIPIMPCKDKVCPHGFRCVSIPRDGTLYVCGGMVSDVDCPLDLVLKYEMTKNRWTVMNRMISARSFFASGVIDGLVYVAGGNSTDLYELDSAEVLDPINGNWRAIANMGTNMASYDAAVLNGKLLVTEGWLWPFYVSPRGQVYDPRTNNWENMAVGLREGWTGSSVVVYGHLFVVSELERMKLKVYDTETDSWEAIEGPPLPEQICKPFAVNAFDCQIYVVGRNLLVAVGYISKLKLKENCEGKWNFGVQWHVINAPKSLSDLTPSSSQYHLLVSESVKAKQLHSSLLSEKQALADQLQKINSSIENSKAKIASSEQQIECILSEAAKCTQDEKHLAVALEFTRWELADAEKELRLLKSVASSSEKEYDQIQKDIEAIEKELDSERSSRKKLEEELMEVNSQIAELKAETGETAVQQLEEEIRVCKNMIKCTVCSDRPKEVVIVKCYHLFCNPCIQRNLELRHRKCPACGTAFGQSDVRFVKI